MRAVHVYLNCFCPAFQFKAISFIQKSERLIALFDVLAAILVSESLCIKLFCLIPFAL
jgi:hypothetical protein